MTTKTTPTCPALIAALMVLDPRNSFEGGLEMGSDRHKQIIDAHQAGKKCPKCPERGDEK